VRCRKASQHLSEEVVGRGREKKDLRRAQGERTGGGRSVGRLRGQ